MQSTREVIDNLNRNFFMYDHARTITLEELAEMFSLSGTSRDHGKWAREHGLNIDLRDLKSARWSMGDITTRILKTGVYGFDLPESVADRIRKTDYNKSNMEEMNVSVTSNVVNDAAPKNNRVVETVSEKQKPDWSATVSALAMLYGVDEERIIEVAVEMFRNAVLSGLATLDALAARQRSEKI